MTRIKEALYIILIGTVLVIIGWAIFKSIYVALEGYVYFLFVSLAYIILVIGVLWAANSETFRKRFSSSNTSNVLAIVGILLTVIFSLGAFDFSRKFSPLSIGDIPAHRIFIMQSDDAVFTLQPLEIKDFKTTISGQFKEFLVGSYIEQDGTEKIVLESVINKNGSLILDRPVHLNLTTFNGEMTFEKKSEDSAKILITFDLVNKANLFYLYVEDYLGNKEYILYVLSLKDNHIVFSPITSKQLYSRQTISNIYWQIDFETDIFWKNKPIKSREEFSSYLIKHYKQLKSAIED